jgi:hypothetical protein
MHHAGGHVVRPETGITVAQSRVDDANFVHEKPPDEAAAPLEEC